MNKDKYYYSLNGIEHEIFLNDNLKIDSKPVNEKILVSNKYLLKYINDLFDYHSIDYCIISNTLLGFYIFSGINIFNSKLEICTLDINFIKIKKLEEEMLKDGFMFEDNKTFIKISSIFFEKINVSIYIYPLDNDSSDDILKINNYDKKNIYYEFYDIFPIKKGKFEEFQLSIPNKIEKVLSSFNINLNYIVFSNKKINNNKSIIEESPKINTINNILSNNINNFISTIKPIFF